MTLVMDTVPIEEEVRRSYLDYAMSVIVSRALPDVRDGLKPVHRRILYAMHDTGCFSDRPYRKSARIVGDVMGKYHPHGDSAIYDALVRLAQPFSMRLPLIDGQGNFGSMDGDSAAAMRYTESRMSLAAHALLHDIDKDTVDFRPNYDGSDEEPTVLPARFPQLLVNGSGGIAVGMATNIPPHNLGEVVRACQALIARPDLTDDELCEIVKGPDFPTGGLIMGTGGLRQALMTGRGSVMMRSRAHLETIGSRSAWVVTEIPYQVNKARLVERIAEMVREKKIEGISDLRDESNKVGVRVVIELKKDAVAEVVLNQLMLHTPLQTSFSVNMLALHDGQPLCLSLRSMLEAFLVFREQVVTRRTQYLLRKARERGHVLMGLALAVHRIDDVIAMIKAAPDPVSAREALMATDWPVGMIAPYLEAIEGVLLEGDGLYRLSEAQAKAILDMRLHRLTQLEHRKILDDVEALVRDIASYKEILASRLRMKAVMHDEFQEILDRFDTPRRTEIHPHAHDCDEEDLIQREDMVVTVTVAGYIKRTPLAVYRSQRRGGRGRAALTMREEDATIQVVMTHTHAPLLFFSSHGKVYKMKVHKLPLGTPQSKGRALVNLLPLASGEVIRTILPLPEDAASWGELNILFATMEGNIRRNSLADFASIQSNGKIAIRLDPSDQLVGVELCQDEEHVLLCTAQGKAIRFPAGSLRVFKSRTSDGVRGMKLQAEDRVISLTILRSAEGDTATREAYLRVPLETRRRWALDAASVESIDLPDGLSLEQAVNMAKDEEFVLAVTANGFGKQTSAYEYRTTHRGGSGITHMMTSDRNGSVVSSFPVSEADDVLLLTNAGRLIRVPSSGVRVSGRATHGVMLLRVDDQEHVVSAARVVETDASEEENSAPDLAGEE